MKKNKMRNVAEAPGRTRTPAERNRGGFTMVEVIIAIVILAFGLMGMAGTTAVVIRQITLSDVATKRNAAQQSVIERLRAADWENLSTTFRTGTETIGPFEVSWIVTAPSSQWGLLEVVTVGPGLGRATGGFPMLTDNVADTFSYRILR